MSEFMLLGVAPWVTNWLTPVWVLSLGVSAGLIGLLVAWGLLFALSRVPGVSSLGEDPHKRRTATWIGTVIALVIYATIAYSVVARHWNQNDRGPNILIGFILVSPVCYLLPRALIMMVTRRAVREIPEAVREGVLWPILWVVLR